MLSTRNSACWNGDIGFIYALGVSTKPGDIWTDYTKGFLTKLMVVMQIPFLVTLRIQAIIQGLGLFRDFNKNENSCELLKLDNPDDHNVAMEMTAELEAIEENISTNTDGSDHNSVIEKGRLLW
ncbi:hypothetical protein L1987_02703 [Smallanthus sonchifolius]|uniref:Uncharacterized protein n=1 Tax=Smallanthus sonchifolius TaxID=185202 RepID=A0ACB9K8K1_9ASTR|nr:hypothetical protein L1987_02703 [Smallanthus sonchifolius]